MAIEYDDLIGFGQTFTAPTAWAAARNTGTFTGQRIGRLLGEEFLIHNNWTLSGGTNSYGNELILTSALGSEHDGRGHDVSLNNHARIYYAYSGRLDINQDHIEISWIEFQLQGNNTNLSFYSRHTDFHHNIVIGGTDLYANCNSLIYIRAIRTGISDIAIYRNIVYGKAAYQGIYVHDEYNSVSVTDIAFYFNTIAKCVSFGTTGSGLIGMGIQGSSSIIAFNIGSNACFDPMHSSIDCIDSAVSSEANVFDFNATSDDTGSLDYRNIDSVECFKYISTDYTLIDLRMRNTDSPLYNVSNHNIANPESRIPITNRYYSVPSGYMSIGADHIVTILNPVPGDLDYFGASNCFDIKSIIPTKRMANNIFVPFQSYSLNSTKEVIFDSKTFIIPKQVRTKIRIEWKKKPVDPSSVIMNFVYNPSFTYLYGYDVTPWGASFECRSSNETIRVESVEGNVYTQSKQSLVELRLDSSINLNGFTEYTYPANDLIQSDISANRVATNLIESFGQDKTNVNVNHPGNLAQELRDEVYCVEYDQDNVTIADYFYITRQNINFDGALNIESDLRRIN